ncbi:MAG: hypothetical protein HQ510_01225 [Candidatus Marinimicrobia bacterium]|nr:hypothetical protein [Candidatus Neomarinimicrobiota bacterium]
MNTPILIASILTLIYFLIHAFLYDREFKLIEPRIDQDENQFLLSKWTMERCGWHLVSLDLLFATIGLGLINFTDFFENENTLLQILAVYFLGYAIVWLLIISISKQFKKNYLILGNWFFLLTISGLIFYGIN